MGLIAERMRARTGALPSGTVTFTLPPGYYVVAYLLDSDPDQSEASRLTIAWANTYRDDIEVIASYLGGTARFAGIRTRVPLPYPVDGKWLCLATATTAQDPMAVYEQCDRTKTAQHEALGELASDKADIAQGGVNETAKLADAAAAGAASALRGQSWLPWAIGGAIGVVGLVALAKLVRG